MKNVIIVLVVLILVTTIVINISRATDVDYCKFNRNPNTETFGDCMKRING